MTGYPPDSLALVDAENEGCFDSFLEVIHQKVAAAYGVPRAFLCTPCTYDYKFAALQHAQATIFARHFSMYPELPSEFSTPELDSLKAEVLECTRAHDESRQVFRARFRALKKRYRNLRKKVSREHILARQ